MHTNESNSGELQVLEDRELDLVNGGSVFGAVQAVCVGFTVSLAFGPIVGAAAAIYADQHPDGPGKS